MHQPIAVKPMPASLSLSLPIPATLPAVIMDEGVFAMAQSGVGDLIIHCTISLDGQIDEARLATALRALMDQEPILGCRLQPGWMRCRWLRRSDLDTFPLCTLLPLDEQPLDAALDAFLTTPVDASVDPLVQVRVFRAETDTICIKVNHVIADAGGTKEIAYLLSDLYRRLAHDDSLTITPNFGDRDFTPVTQNIRKRAPGAIFRRFLADLRVRFFPPRIWRFPAKRAPATERTYVLQHLSPSLCAALKAYGRAHDATLNDLIVTAYMRALHRLIQPKNLPMRTLNTVDLRRYLPARRTEAICNLSSFSYPHLGRQLPGPAFEDTLASFRALMLDLKANHIGTGDVLLFPFLRYLPHAFAPTLMRFLFKTMYRYIPPSLTNMGVISHEALSFGPHAPVLHAFLSPSVVFPPFFMLGVSGFKGRLSLCAGFCQSSIPRATVEAFFADIILEISQITEAFKLPHESQSL